MYNEQLKEKKNTRGCIYKRKHCNSNMTHNEAVTIAMTKDDEGEREMC